MIIKKIKFKNMKKIEINNVTITKSFEVNALTINKIDIELNKSARISYTLHSNERPVESGFIELIGDDYNNWSTDDNYIIEKILKKYV